MTSTTFTRLTPTPTTDATPNATRPDHKEREEAEALTRAAMRMVSPQEVSSASATAVNYLTRWNSDAFGAATFARWAFLVHDQLEANKVDPTSRAASANNSPTLYRIVYAKALAKAGVVKEARELVISILRRLLKAYAGEEGACDQEPSLDQLVTREEMLEYASSAVSSLEKAEKSRLPHPDVSVEDMVYSLAHEVCDQVRSLCDDPTDQLIDTDASHRLHSAARWKTTPLRYLARFSAGVAQVFTAAQVVFMKRSMQSAEEAISEVRQVRRWWRHDGMMAFRHLFCISYKYHGALASSVFSTTADLSDGEALGLVEVYREFSEDKSADVSILYHDDTRARVNASLLRIGAADEGLAFAHRELLYWMSLATTVISEVCRAAVVASQTEDVRRAVEEVSRVSHRYSEYTLLSAWAMDYIGAARKNAAVIQPWVDTTSFDACTRLLQYSEEASKRFGDKMPSSYVASAGV